ncbi:shikimate kinase [Devosia neptuniae]|jgi:hypothetical protein|uniref:shikimate kinase n=1 Tax=Devosia TaxID=46913 RepID=UPI0022B07E2E|nr:shikimate kinase [Devosia neptuniae]MCZ4344572.1 shikimate kinase [Devosia neptuniae]|tara:strand:+ start:5404 stop:5892 length:489 start_codon:yes stop_codon:yes gene_type:complete
MLVVVLNGPINAGKTTTGKALAAIVPRAAFFDGDDHDAPDDAPLVARIEASMRRLEHLIATADGAVLVLATPLRHNDYQRLLRVSATRHADLRVVTLAPPVETATSNRGSRQLRPDEILRTRQMYVEGYASREFSDLTIVDMATPRASAVQICHHFGLSPKL